MPYGCPLVFAQSNNAGRKPLNWSRETQIPSYYIAVANSIKNRSPLPPHHMLSCSSKYYKNECPRLKVPKECMDRTSRLFLGRQTHHDVARLLSKRVTSNIHWRLGVLSLDARLSQYRTFPDEITHQGHRDRIIRTEIHIQSVPATEGVKIQLSYWQHDTPFFTSHTSSKPTTKHKLAWRTLLDKVGRVDWNKPVSYSSAWSDSTSALYSLDDCYPGKQQKMAYFKNSSVLFYPRVITEHSRHSFWRAEYNSCLLPPALQSSIYLSLSHTEQTAQKVLKTKVESTVCKKLQVKTQVSTRTKVWPTTHNLTIR